MKKALILTLFLAAAVLLMSSTAQSQDPAWGDYNYTDSVFESPGLSLHGGGAFLTGNTRDSNTYIVGLDYQTVFDESVEPAGFLTFEADVMPVQTLTTGTEQVVPIMIGYRQYKPFAGTRLFFQVAGGTRYSTNSIPELKIKKNFDFGWAARVGAELTKSIYIQGGYLAGSHPNDDGAWTAELGIRF